MWNDPIIEEIRKHRNEHAKKFNYDIKSIGDDIKKREKEDKKTQLKSAHSK